MEKLYRSLEKQLSSAGSDVEKYEYTVKAISNAFGCTPDEVGIFSLSDGFLSFIWPMRLRTAGSLPINADKTLAAKTCREGLSVIDNTFQSTPHASIFENFRLHPDFPSVPIQKIMSVPLVRDGKTIGVIQVSRKGTDHAFVGEDFTDIQLRALTRIAEVLACFI